MSFRKVGFGLALIATLTTAGCGSSTPTASNGSASAASAPANTWVKTATIAKGDQVAKEEPDGQHLWMLVQTPATANHGPGLVGEVATAGQTGLSKVTPTLYFGTASIAAWGRSSSGAWWVASAQEDSEDSYGATVRTAVWKPGAPAWTLLTPQYITDPYMSFNTASIVRDVNGSGWLLEDNEQQGNLGAGGRTVVYRLSESGWKVLHTFPEEWPRGWSQAVFGISNGPGSLLICPEGTGCYNLSSSGTLTLATEPPKAAENVLLDENANNNVVGIDGSTLYIGPTPSPNPDWVPPTTGDLWQWAGDQFTDLIQPGSLMTQARYIGVWQHDPAMSVLAGRSTAVYVYRGGQWSKAPDLVMNGHVAKWDGSTLWVLAGQAIYARQGTAEH